MANSRVLPKVLSGGTLAIICLLSTRSLALGEIQSARSADASCQEITNLCSRQSDLHRRVNFSAVADSEKLAHHDITVDYEIIDDAEIWYPVLYRDKNFDRIEAFVEQSLEAERTDEQVSAYLTRLYDSLSEYPSAIGSADSGKYESQFLANIAVIDEWISANPRSHIPYLIKGELLSNYAWDMRYGRVTYIEPEEDRVGFSQLVAQAKENFDTAAELNADDPNVWAALMFSTRENSSIPTHMEEAYFEAGLAASPHHIDLWGTKAFNQRPGWGGSWEEMMSVARESEQHARNANKPLLSVIFLSVHRHIAHHNDDFDLGHPDIWPEAQSVFLRTIEAYPESLRMRFYYAHDAYFYADKHDIAVAQFDILGNRWTGGTAWNDLEEYHSARRDAYQSVAHEALSNGDYDRAEQMALKSIEIESNAYPYLILASVSSHRYEPQQIIYYAEQALASNPTVSERAQAEEAIEIANYHMNPS